MTVKETGIAGLLIVEPRVFHDDRGYFFESYNRQAFEKLGIEYDFVQDNQSFSSYGTVRGLHFQKGAHSQAKLVRVLSGHVRDVAVDLRAESPTFGKHYAVDLTAENKLMFMIPRGFAHGFSVLSETAEFAYKCDNFYNKESEGGIFYNDADLSIDWGVEPDRAIISDKDRVLPSFKEVVVSCI